MGHSQSKSIPPHAAEHWELEELLKRSREIPDGANFTTATAAAADDQTSAPDISDSRDFESYEESEEELVGWKKVRPGGNFLRKWTEFIWGPRRIFLKRATI